MAALQRARRLQSVDFAMNPHARQFGKFGSAKCGTASPARHRYCTDLGLPDGLDLHSLRRSYATHLLEDGWDPRFVQFQMGHVYASTTGIYQFVSDDFRARTQRTTLNRTVGDALTSGDGG